MKDLKMFWIFSPVRDSPKEFHIILSDNTVHVFFTVATVCGNDLV